MDTVIKNAEGKAVFIGQDQEWTQSPVKRIESSNMVCPVCGVEVPYLVGEDTHDGGRKGCEQCWKPGGEVHYERQETEKTVFD